MKVCLAGSYAITEQNKMEFNNVPFMLESFYYIKDWQLPHIKNAKLFLLDSGAFTFMNNTAKGNVNWQEYIDKYAEFIIKNDIKYFFELDIDVIVGYEKVKKYTRYLENKVGRKCIPVWHKSRGLEEWKKLTKEYDYVAIGGIVTKEITRKEYPVFKQLLKIARDNNCKVHGLGFTNLNELPKYHFYSVDSTSWKSGNRFGTLYLFKENKLLQIKKKENKRLVSGSRYAEVEKFVLNEWMKYQYYADKFL